ncbi:MAG: mannose-1-phosphate guanylyltransferase [Candidatus Berkelbacteria bacterium]|nr:mannose-1-phosphate guanylyltransferase [Candidatus Berkelbacteria bacterium]
MFVVIMAGGGGTRLWPKSRIKKPKQLQSLISEESMVKNTVKRILPLIPKEKIYIATNKEHVKEIKKQIPEIKNIIKEPLIRNTGPCIALASLILSKKNENEPAAFIPSDHHVGNESEFRRVLKLAAKTAEKDYLVTIGITPTEPDTGLGHIKMGKSIGHGAFDVDKFIEKPNLETAKKFVKSGKYLWNGGIYVGKPRIILDLFKKHAPDIYKILQSIDKNPGTLTKEYAKMENISVDYAISEKAEKIAVVPGNLNWSDIGSWSKLLEVLSQNVGENVVVGCNHYGIDTESCLIHGSDRLIATIGLKDVIVVDTPDVVLVCHKDKAQDVKKIVEKLKEEKKDHYL